MVSRVLRPEKEAGIKMTPADTAHTGPASLHPMHKG